MTSVEQLVESLAEQTQVLGGNIETVRNTHSEKCWSFAQWGRPSRVRSWRWCWWTRRCWGGARVREWTTTRCWRRPSAGSPRTVCPTGCPARRVPCCFARSTSQQHFTLRYEYVYIAESVHTWSSVTERTLPVHFSSHSLRPTRRRHKYTFYSISVPYTLFYVLRP
jgi:hypothetical protein